MQKVNKDLTVILVIKDRPKFTLRWMKYANEIGFPFKVLIADGGSDKELEAILRQYDLYSNIVYEYIRYPYDQTYTEYYKKMSDVLQKVDTEYSALIDDDDFFVVSGLLRSIEFLRANPDYVTCRGITTSFRNTENGIIFGNVNIENSIEDSSPCARVLEHLSKYNVTHYDVHRTSSHVRYFNQLADLDADDIILSELLTSLLAAAEGKIMHADYPYLFREVAHTQSANQNETMLKGDYFNRIISKGWSKDFSGFIEKLAKAISATGEMDKTDAENTVKIGYRKHITRTVISDLLESANVSSIKTRIAKLFVYSIISDDGFFLKRLLGSAVKMGDSISKESRLEIKHEMKKIELFLKNGNK